jgi:CHASE3 domain sensor protein
MSGKNRGSWLAVIILVIALLILSYLFVAMRSVFDDARAVGRDATAVKNTLLLKKLVLEMQSSKRGFMLSGEEEFLEPYIAAENEFGMVIDAELSAEKSVARRAQFERIQQLMEQWVRESARPEIQRRRDVNIGRANLGELELMARSHVGDDIMEQVRIELRKLSTSDEQQLAEKFAKLERQAENLKLVLAALVGMVVLGFAGLLYKRFVR